MANRVWLVSAVLLLAMLAFVGWLGALSTPRVDGSSHGAMIQSLQEMSRALPPEAARRFDTAVETILVERASRMRVWTFDVETGPPLHDLLDGKTAEEVESLAVDYILQGRRRCEPRRMRRMRGAIRPSMGQ